MQATQIFQNKPINHTKLQTDYDGDSPAEIPLGSSEYVNSLNVEGTISLSNILRLQATFLYSIYHQCKTKYIRGVNFTLGYYTIYVLVIHCP